MGRAVPERVSQAAGVGGGWRGRVRGGDRVRGRSSP